MKVCLVSYPTVSELDPRDAESDNVRRISEHVPIGILTLAAILEQHGVTAEVIDLNQVYYRYLRSDAYRRRKVDFCAYVGLEFASRYYDIWGLSTICSTYPLSLRIATEVRKSHPEAVIMLGGPQASAADVATLEAFPAIDLIVRGEADETLPPLLEALPDPRRLARVAGITYRCGKRVLRNPDAEVIADLDPLPLPAFHLCSGLKKCYRVPLEAGRGCPFACRFCSTSNFFRRRFRFKSPGRILEQMYRVHRTYGQNHFELIHDAFTADRRRVVEFCEALLADGARFFWNCSARTDCIDDDLIALMARAGCDGIFFGIETGAERLQRSIRKNLDLSEAALRIGSVMRHGIHTTVSLITGFPDETREDLRDTVAFLMDAARFDKVKTQLHLLAPLAATPIQEQYRDRLLPVEIRSDISGHGWRQDPAERELIGAHPEVFPNFYALPTLLDRQDLRELRDFLQHSLLRCPWLAVALHQDSGDLLAVFDRWKAWRAQHRPRTRNRENEPYYSRTDFWKDLLEFVRTAYLPGARSRRALAVLWDFESAFARKQAAAPKTPGVPRVAPGVRIIPLGADYGRIVACLRNCQKLDGVPARRVMVAARRLRPPWLEVVRLSPLARQLLGLCDGRHSPAQIARRLRLGKALAGIPRQKACLFGLGELRKQGLVEWPGITAADARTRSRRR